MMHPADHLRGTRSDKLKGRRIVLGVTGSVGAVECVKLCRDLIRNGAQVQVVMTHDAQKIIHPWAMEFASGRPVIVEITGKVEHVSYCGDVPDRYDLLLIAPATANTISKMACGIDDTPVTTFATTAIGSGMPVMVVPAMHGSMMNHKVVTENIKTLGRLGVTFLQPKIEESKAKMPESDYIVSSVISRIGKGDLHGIKVLVIAGATEERIDDVRVVTNKSTGETGIELAKAAYERGANLDLWMGRCDADIPGYIQTRRFSTFSDLSGMMRQVKHDVVLVPAAISDYSPKAVPGKIPSDLESVKLLLKRNPKLIDRVKANVVVGFKAQSTKKDAELVKDASELLERSKCSFVVANRVADVKRGKTRVIIVNRSCDAQEIEGTKAQVAEKIIDRVVELIE